MRLKLIKRESHSHVGYGAGSGSIDKSIYECPCGEGTVVYQKDNIPGFKERMIYSICTDCNKQYEFGNGTAELK